MKYIAAIDIGGTFTDCVVVDEHGTVTLAKAFSTPPDFSQGILNALGRVAEELAIERRELIENTRLFLHSTTVAENAVVDGNLVKAGLITTAGFEQTLFATRGGFGRWSGLTEDEIRNPIATDKPEPLIPFERIRPIRERLDHEGTVIHSADPEEIRQALEALLASGATSVGVCLLWSFVQPEHEELVRTVARELDPDLFVSLSSEVAPISGEYERTSTVALDASLGPVVRTYFTRMQERLDAEGFAGELLVMQAYGGLLPVGSAADHPVGMLESGPVSGVMGCQHLGSMIGFDNIISADMGGTTFKVGTVRDGRIEYQRESMVLRYHYALPKRDIVSLGLAGGTVVWIDERTGAPKLGPRGAGSYPGPVCYGHGGTEVTLTDVDLILGYLNAEYFVGGRESLDLAAARRALNEQVAEPLSTSLEEAAGQVYRLANSAVYDLLHRTTIQRGLDPAKFAIFSTGGTAGMHLPTVGQQLGVSQVVVPYSASVQGAFGLVVSDIVHEEMSTRPQREPFDVDQMNERFDELSDRAREQLATEGFSPDQMSLVRSVDMRFRRQVHIVTVPVELNIEIDRPGPITDAGVKELIERFDELYKERYGPESSFREAGLELVAYRVRASGRVRKPEMLAHDLGPESPERALVERRRIYVAQSQSFEEAPAYAMELLDAGNVIEGPAVIWSPITTIVLDRGHRARCDPHKNLIITFGRQKEEVR